MRSTLLFIFLISFFLTKAQTWTILGTGENALNTNYPVSTILLDHSGNVYAAGLFTNAEGYNYVAKWDGTKWSEVGTGSNALNANSSIYSLIMDDTGYVYVSGQFGDANGNYVAKWNGTNWSKLESNSWVLSRANGNQGAICLFKNPSGVIYASGGDLSNGGTTPGQWHYNFAKWDGTTWVDLLDGGTFHPNGYVSSVVFDANQNIYVTGSFGDYPVWPGGSRFAMKSDGATWDRLGSFGSAYDIASQQLIVDDTGYVYAAGHFNEGTFVKRWDGISWKLFGEYRDFNGYIYCMAFDPEGNLYVSGMIKNASGKTYIAKWDGTSWSELLVPDHNNVSQMIIDENMDLYISNYSVVAKTNLNAVIPPVDPPVTTSVKTQAKLIRLHIYPNPSKGRIQFLDLSEDIQLFIYNAQGECVSSQSVSKNTNYMDLSHLAAGIYSLVFSGENNSYAPVKWIKE